MGGEHIMCSHNDTSSWFHRDDNNPEEPEYEPIIITAAHQQVYEKVRWEIMKFVKECYLKSRVIKDFLGEALSFSEEDFNISGLVLARQLTNLDLNPYWRDPQDYLVMIYDIAKLLCLALPGIFCVYFDRSSYHGDFAEYRCDWEISGAIHNVRFTKIPFFNFYRIPDINTSKKFMNAETDRTDRLEGRLNLDASEFINKLSQPYAIIKSDDKNIHLTPKQKLIIDFLKSKLISIDVVDLICNYLYVDGHRLARGTLIRILTSRAK